MVSFLVLFDFLRKVGKRIFGGIFFDGYKSVRVIFYVKNDIKLKVYEYDFLFLVGIVEEEIVDLKVGRNVIDLRIFFGIVGFELEKEVKGKVRIEFF